MTDKVLMKGNEALAEAAIIAGCRHYFAYPITPQNEIPSYMAKRMPEVNGCFIQAESELAAVNMVIGAAAGGVRAMTSSSSPGMALKQEGMSALSGAELPCVVVNVMRGGPGLGGIAGSQADYYMATRGGGNGDYRNIVLTPGNGQELADFTIEAFDLADEYRMPVILLADGYLGQMSEPVILPKPSGKTFEKPWALTGASGRKQNIIATLRLGAETVLENHNLALQAKYDRVTENVRKFEAYHCDDAEWIVVAYGTASRVTRKAIDRMRNDGIRAGLFRLKCVWPFPDRELLEYASGSKKVLTVEMSLGQMYEDVRLAINGAVDIDFYGRPGGALPTEEEIIGRIQGYINKEVSHVQAS